MHIAEWCAVQADSNNSVTGQFLLRTTVPDCGGVEYHEPLQMEI